MKFKDPITGEYKTLHLKTGDTLPVGTIVSFEGDEIPEGYEEVIGEEARVVISPTEPTTGEEVWIQKGKNLFNKDNLYIPYDYDTKISILDTGIRATAIKSVGNSRYAAIKLDKNLLGKTINLSSIITKSSTNSPYLALFFGTDEKPFLQSANIGLGQTGSTKGTLPNQFPDGCNGLYLLAYVNTNGTYQVGDYVDYTNLQIEIGESATSYEPYINKKIHIKNDNGDYEEFYDETNRETYSTSEQRIGTWIDGKPLYRKTIKYTTPNTSEYVVVADVGQCNVKHFYGQCDFGGGNIYPIPYGEGQFFNVIKYLDGGIYASTNGFEDKKCEVTIEYTKTD